MNKRFLNLALGLVADNGGVKYSNFLKNGGEQWIKLDFKGVKITTRDTYKLDAAITQNYNVQTTLVLPSHRTSFEFGVFAPNTGIEYKDELVNGFDLTIETPANIRFNISCTVYAPRVSIIKTANIDLEVLPYRNAIYPNKKTFYIKVLNDISFYRDSLEFRIEGDATNSSVPMMVKLDLVPDVVQSDLDKLKDMIKNAPSVTLNEYTQESYVRFQRKIREASNIAYSSKPGQAEVKEMINKLADAIDSLEKIEKLDEVVNI